MTEKIRNLQDLKAAQEKARADIDLRNGEKDMRVTVHMGTCGIAAGARDVLMNLLDILGNQAAEKVSIQQAGCAGRCDQEPMISINDKSGGTWRYGKVDKDKLKQIVEQHLQRGNPVSEYLMKS